MIIRENNNKIPEDMCEHTCEKIACVRVTQ